MNPSATNTDPGGAGEWALDDQVVQLREWGTDRVYRLPPAPIDEWTVGSSTRCSLQLRDPPRYISRLHARLVRTYGTWFIHDAGSKNGLWQDNARRPSFALTPGLEIGIGSLLLVAESPRSIVLRGFVARMLGWDLHRLSDIDRALRALRSMATMRAPLLLCGEGNLVDLARQLHVLTLGAAAPFVVSDPRRRRGPAQPRAATNYVAGLEALEAARDGTLCLWAHRLPADIERVTEQTHRPDARTRLVVCAHTVGDTTAIVGAPVFVTPLSQRAHELARVIDEYADDAIVSLGADPACFLREDHDWLVAQHPSSLSEIATSTRRLVAIRQAGTITRAAARLGISHVALSRWLGRRT